MRLLLSLFDDPIALSNENFTQKNFLLLVDTISFQRTFINTPILEFPHAGITGMDYSGDWLCANFFSVEDDSICSYLYLINLISGKTFLHDLKFVHYAHDIVSVYPGQTYINCIRTDTMVGVLFSPVTGHLVREDIHFTLPEGGYGKFGFNSMHNYKNKWYAALMMDGQSYNGSIMELSNQRAIYSNLNKPNSVIFNCNHRICFCEGGAGKVHIGDMISHVGGYPQGIIEDPNMGGYWVAVHQQPGTSLKFIKYNGSILKESIPLENLNVFRIIESKGKWLSSL